jgi:hypothetical protein
MDQERVYVLTDRGTVGDTRWIVCEVRDAEDHSCHGILIHKHIYYMVNKATVTYKTETSGDFPITEIEGHIMAKKMIEADDLWRQGPGTQIGPPKALKHKLEW